MNWLRKPTPVRRLLWIRAVGMALIGITVGLLPVLVETDVEGRWFAFGFAAFCGLLAIVNLSRAVRTREGETVTRAIEHLPVSDQQRQLRRILTLSAIAFPLVSIWNAIGLSNVGMPVFEPSVMIYAVGGFIPAVLFYPCLGLYCCLGIWWPLRKLATRKGDEEGGRLEDYPTGDERDLN